MPNEIVRRTQADPEFQAGLVGWSVCMREKGFSYDHPQEAAKNLTKVYRDGLIDIKELRRQEIATLPLEFYLRTPVKGLQSWPRPDCAWQGNPQKIEQELGPELKIDGFVWKRSQSHVNITSAAIHESLWFLLLQGEDYTVTSKT